MLLPVLLSPRYYGCYSFPHCGENARETSVISPLRRACKTPPPTFQKNFLMMKCRSVPSRSSCTKSKTSNIVLFGRNKSLFSWPYRISSFSLTYTSKQLHVPFYYFISYDIKDVVYSPNEVSYMYTVHTKLSRYSKRYASEKENKLEWHTVDTREHTSAKAADVTKLLNRHRVT